MAPMRETFRISGSEIYCRQLSTEIICYKCQSKSQLKLTIFESDQELWELRDSLAKALDIGA